MDSADFIIGNNRLFTSSHQELQKQKKIGELTALEF